MGIARSRKAAQDAQIIIALTEPGKDEEILDFTRGRNVLKVLNKCDLYPDFKDQNRICISAKHGDIEPLKQELVRVAKAGMQPSAVMLSNARHYEAVSRAHEAILRVQQGLDNSLSGELLSLDLQDCLNALGEVTGQITNQEVLSNIFSKFCIGK